MKMIVAIIRPEKLDAVQAALSERDVYLMTVTDDACALQSDSADLTPRSIAALNFNYDFCPRSSWKLP